MIRIVFFLVRTALLIALLYLIYSFYKSLQKSPKKTPITTCPSPKIFIDYTEGIIKGEKKKAIANHIAHCKNCQDALKGVFDMPKSK